MPAPPGPWTRASMTGAVVCAVLGLLQAGSLGQTPSGAASLDELVAVERAFAAATATLGVRNGFLTFFAPDAITLEARADGTARLPSAMAGLAASPDVWPAPDVLSWVPLTGQVSTDGALGWLTGPYERRVLATGVVRRGLYFSVWRRQANGVWQVWLDQGMAAVDPAPVLVSFSPAEAPGAPAVEDVATVEAQAGGDGTVWTARLSPRVRLHRDGQVVVGARAVGDWRKPWHALRYRTARIVAGGALAVSVGGYAGTTQAGEQHGVFVRVWQTDAAGRWTIVFETSRAA